MSENQKLALLIDGDNINSKKIQEILDLVNTKGKALIKRVYNNKASMEHWEPIIGKYSLYSVWVPNNTKNKNSVDIALVVDAMSLLYERPDLDGFCIVSSDADHTALVKHILTKDKYVLGIGNTNTPEPFRNSCTEFVDLDELVSTTSPVEQVTITQPIATPVQEISDSELLKLVTAAYKKVAKGGALNTDAGWIQLLNIKAEMLALKPTFQPTTRTLAERLKTLAKSSPRIIEIRENLDTKPVVHFVRLLKDSEIDKFHHAYNHVTEELKSQDKQGWVMLTTMRITLQKLFPKYDPLTYQGVKSNQLKKVIEKMIKDYPNIIEIKTQKLDVYIRMKK